MYWAIKARNEVSRKTLASASFAASKMSLTNKVLEEKETDLLESLAKSDKSHEVLVLIDPLDFQQIRNAYISSLCKCKLAR